MIEIAVYSDIGPRRENQDRTIGFSRSGYHVIGVADGLGGHFGGGVAAQIVVDTLLQHELASPSDLVHAFEIAHETILLRQAEDENFRDMGSTATVVMMTEDSLFGVHVGDTRCVLQRGHGIIRLTKEHTEANRLLEVGKLSKEEFATYPRKNVLDNALGSKRDFWIDTFQHGLKPGDHVLITSDGVHDKIKLREALNFLESGSNPNQIVDRLKEELAARGPEDNFSMALASID